MIKEIVDIGRVSNRFGSVFTFKGLPEYYVEILLEWNGQEFDFKLNEKVKHLSEDEEYSHIGQELYLKYGVHRGKKSNIIYIFPTSFIYESKDKVIEQILNFLVTETKYNQIFDTLKKLEFGVLEYDKKTKKLKIKITKTKNEIQKIGYPKILEFIKDDKIILYPKITKYYKSILSNIDSIDSLVEEAKLKIKSELKNKKTSATIKNLLKNIPVIVKLKENEQITFFYKKNLLFRVLENIEFNNSANLIKNPKDAYCNIYQNKKALVYPSGGFYYPFSTDKVNVKYNLKDDKNLFLLSKEAYIDFLKGRTFLETYNGFRFMNLNCYITATSLNDNSLKEFQNDIKEAKSNIEGLINLIDKNRQNRFDILLNFYFWEAAKTGGGKDIIEYIKDVIPSNLVQILKSSNSLVRFYKEKFNRDNFNFSWQQHLYNIYHKDAHKKFRTSLFRKIALGDKVDLDKLMLVMNENMEYSINKDGENKYYYGTVIKHLMFLDWLGKINKGELNMNKREERDKEFFIGKTYEERLSYFLKHGNLVKESSSMKIGVCIGLAINILSWTLSNYDKKTLAFAGKRIERNNLNSVQVFMNEIFSKSKFQEYEGLQSVNIRLATMQMLNIDNNSFNKDEFIFGLFLGSELYRNVKSKKDPEPKNNNEGNEDEQSTTGE